MYRSKRMLKSGRASALNAASRSFIKLKGAIAILTLGRITLCEAVEVVSFTEFGEIGNPEEALGI